MKRTRIWKNFIVVTLCFLKLNDGLHAQEDGPSNKHATKEAVNLYRNLKALAAKGFMFGHQDDLAYGVEWRYKEGESDIRQVTGDYPAVYGWDLGGIERANNDKNIDGIPFSKMQNFIREGYERSGVITISWHADSPLGAPKGAWDTTYGTVASILPGGVNHEKYRGWLDQIALFFAELKGPKGELIPILFRPFHELTGNWFWWCKNACTENEFKSLWRFTIEFFRRERGLHNLLFVYNTSADFNSEQEFLARYPGDDVVDMLSIDTYQYDDPSKSDAFEKNTNRLLSIVGKLAKEKNKLFALSETGYEAIPYSKWWTGTLMNAIGDNEISYVLVWRNHGYAEWNKKMHYYAPYKGQVSAEDFLRFYNLDRTLFEKDVKLEKLYDSRLVSSSQ